MPSARILSVGDELVLGRVTDTNATFLCRLLTDQGFRVVGSQQVGDGQTELVTAIRQCCTDADVLLISGGLGPTDDDRTRHALADVLEVELLEHAPSWAAIVRRYTQVAPGRDIPPNNRRQALLPCGAKSVANDRGTAPGVLATVKTGSRRTIVAVFPGVPHEMKAMAVRVVASLPKRFPGLLPGLQPPSITEIWFAGTGESAAQQRLGDLLTERNPQVGITVSELGHITIRVVGKPRQVASSARKIRACLTEFLLPEPTLAASVVARLAKLRGTITAAESCTGGHVAALITAVPGASQVLHESLVSYHSLVKIARLGVPADIIANGVVSEACARAMAVGALARSSATIAVATTGIAGPAGGTANTPVGTVWLAVATKRGTAARKVLIQGTRERIQARAATAAVQLVWDILIGRIATDD